MSAFLRPVLALDGTEQAWSETGLTLDGPCTIEGWVRLDPQGRKIGNADGFFGSPGQIDLNFHDSRFRVFTFAPHHDVVMARKPLMAGLWTHVATTRDAAGIWKLYIDGELDAAATRPVPGWIENARLGWSGAAGGTHGMFAELRIWKVERTAAAIRRDFDRVLQPWAADPTLKDGIGNQAPPNLGLVFRGGAETGWGKLKPGAKVVKTSDFPPVLTADEAAALDAKYAQFRAMAEQPGDPAKGRAVAALCQTCHLFGTAGGNIGPNLSGVGAMGTEAILRNILQPNAAMENGYRIYRVELKSGDLVDALFVSEDKDALVVRLPGNDDRRIPRAEIREAKYLRRSLMPDGLLDALPPDQVRDLFAYLLSLK